MILWESFDKQILDEDILGSIPQAGYIPHQYVGPETMASAVATKSTSAVFGNLSYLKRIHKLLVRSMGQWQELLHCSKHSVSKCGDVRLLDV
jgi:hypothetical protein